MAATTRREVRAILLIVSILSVTAWLPSSATAAISPDRIWSDAVESEVTATGERLIRPLAYRLLRLDDLALTAFLQAAPMERQPDTADRRPILTLPLPDGGFGRFALEESHV